MVGKGTFSYSSLNDQKSMLLAFLIPKSWIQNESL